MSRLRLPRLAKICDYHETQDSDEFSINGKKKRVVSEDSFCGLIAFNNLMHEKLLNKELCDGVAMKWVNASDEKDEALRKVGDNENRGAYHIGVLKVALEKKGYTLINIRRRLHTIQPLAIEDVWKSVPVYFLVQQLPDNDGKIFSHAVSICDKHYIHDCDEPIPRKLKNVQDLNGWMVDKQFNLGFAYKLEKRAKKAKLSNRQSKKRLRGKKKKL
jgi:hypothetical protein